MRPAQSFDVLGTEDYQGHTLEVRHYLAAEGDGWTQHEYTRCLIDGKGYSSGRAVKDLKSALKWGRKVVDGWLLDAALHPTLVQILAGGIPAEEHLVTPTDAGQVPVGAVVAVYSRGQQRPSYVEHVTHTGRVQVAYVTQGGLDEARKFRGPDAHATITRKTVPLEGVAIISLPEGFTPSHAPEPEPEPEQGPSQCPRCGKPAGVAIACGAVPGAFCETEPTPESIDYQAGDPVTVTPTHLRYGGLPYIEDRKPSQTFGTGPALPAWVTGVSRDLEGNTTGMSITYGPGQVHHAGVYLEELTPREDVDPEEHRELLEQLVEDFTRRAGWATIPERIRAELAADAERLSTQLLETASR